MKIYFYTLAIVSMILLNGCNQKEKKESMNTQNNKVIKLATVNSHTITDKVLGKKSDEFNKLSSKEKKRTVIKLCDYELLAQYIFSIVKEPKGIDENERIQIALGLIKERVLKEVLPLVSDENLSKYYEKNRELYLHEEHIEASHILVKTEKEAEDILKKLKEVEKDDLNATFQKLAKEYSIDKKSSKSGGYLGHFEKKFMVKPFQLALDTLTAKTYTQKPIKTKFGYHIIYLHSINPKGYFTFKEMKESIYSKILKHETNMWYYKKLEELRKKSKIIYLYDKKQH